MGDRLQVLRRVLGLRAMTPPHVPRFFVMSDEKRLADPVALVPYLPKGCAIILRHYQDPKREQLAKRLVKAARRRKIKVLIAGDAALAQRCGADGVHYPEFALKRLCGKPRQLKKERLTTGAVHNRSSAAKAKKLAIGISIISPVFATDSHPNQEPLGRIKFLNLTRLCGRKSVALGGISEKTAPQLKSAEPLGLAGIGIFKQ